MQFFNIQYYYMAYYNLLQRRFKKRLYCVFAICVFLPP